MEAPSDTTLDLFDAVAYAADQPGVVAVSMSWGSAASTYTEPTDYDEFMVTPTGHANVLFVAASGDTAGVLTYPAASQEVLSVGGENTDIGLNEAVQVVGAWAGGDGTGSGGGPDTIYAKPYPIPDVALDADPLTGVWVYRLIAGSSRWADDRWWVVSHRRHKLRLPCVGGVDDHRRSRVKHSRDWAVEHRAGTRIEQYDPKG